MSADEFALQPSKRVNPARRIDDVPNSAENPSPLALRTGVSYPPLITALQRSVGNRVVADYLNSAALQRKPLKADEVNRKAEALRRQIKHFEDKSDPDSSAKAAKLRAHLAVHYPELAADEVDIRQSAGSARATAEAGVVTEREHRARVVDIPSRQRRAPAGETV